MTAASLLALALAASAAEPAPWAADLGYFADAKAAVRKAFSAVLEVVVSHPGKPSYGFRRLPFQPAPDPDAEPAVDCQRLEPAPSRRPGRGGQAPGSPWAVCGVRLLRWSLGEADRIQLAVTGERAVGRARWLEVVLDPTEDRRGWLRFAPGGEAAPLMRLEPVAEWVRRGGRVTIAARAVRDVVLRSGPGDEYEPAARQLPQGAGDLAAAVRGAQGRWMRIALEGESCERAREPGEEQEACAAGWVRWRADGGEPLLFP